MSIVAIFLALNCPAPAAVLIPAPNSSSSQYAAMLQATADLETPTQVLERSRGAELPRQSLLRDFKEAQFAFLSADLNVARTKFESLVQRRTEQDWMPGDSEIFRHAYLRLAQMASNPVDRRVWLERAAGEATAPNERQIYPPPLISELVVLNARLKKEVVSFSGLGEEWTRIRLNGRSCLRNPCAWPAAGSDPVRVTWISDRWQPVTVTASLTSIRVLIPERRPWVDGACDSFTLATATKKFKDPRPFFDLECKSLAAYLPANRLEPMTTDEVQWPRQPSAERPFYKSPWTWIGAGVIVAAVIFSQKRSERDRQPTTSYGY